MLLLFSKFVPEFSVLPFFFPPPNDFNKPFYFVPHLCCCIKKICSVLILCCKASNKTKHLHFIYLSVRLIHYCVLAKHLHLISTTGGWIEKLFYISISIRVHIFKPWIYKIVLRKTVAFLPNLAVNMFYCTYKRPE